MVGLIGQVGDAHPGPGRVDVGGGPVSAAERAQVNHPRAVPQERVGGLVPGQIALTGDLTAAVQGDDSAEGWARLALVAAERAQVNDLPALP
jgi:hypothetical protein